MHLERFYSILDLKLVIDDYMDYYNNDHYQWD
ncbi:IS3 family transposase [Clostridium frigoriphilum]|uniref:IS3 family transposase n=1 Tax=Clostridium frigoriphilum TaxID=443253 RepID=A0ABU7UVG3_9CLOT